MATPGERQLAFETLWGRVLEFLGKGQALAARTVLLEAWRTQRHSVLAEVIDALDVQLMRPLGQVPGDLAHVASKPPVKTFVFDHAWRQWFTRPADVVANRLAIFEEYPDPAATRVVLELLHVAPQQLLIAERLWSVVERVLIALADVRALNSLARFVDGHWPHTRPHLAIQSVPHLVAALERLRALPPEPALELPAALEARLGSELAVVRTCSEVSPLNQAEANRYFERFISAPVVSARLLLADWLIETGDPRGLLLNTDHGAEADPDVECLRVRAAQRWLSTASHPMLEVGVRAGLPWRARVGVDPDRSRESLAEPWPLWPIIHSFVVDGWDDSFSAITQRLGALEELRGVPWRVARTMKIAGLEVLHTDADGLPVDELPRICSQLREFVGRCSGALSAFDRLPSLSSVTLDMPVRLDRLLDLAAREVAQRCFRTPWCEHQLTGRPGQLHIETTVWRNWYVNFNVPGDNAEPPDAEENLFAALDSVRTLFEGIAEWGFAPGNAEAVDSLGDWLEARGLSGRQG